MEALVYDRTAADVAEAQACQASGVNAAQRLKGCYDHIDRNRVGGAINELSVALNAAGYSNSAWGKADWEQGTLVTQQLNALTLSSVAELRRVFAVLPDTPPAPVQLRTYENANDIERILAALWTCYQWLMAANARYYSDLTYFQ